MVEKFALPQASNEAPFAAAAKEATTQCLREVNLGRQGGLAACIQDKLHPTGGSGLPDCSIVGDGKCNGKAPLITPEGSLERNKTATMPNGDKLTVDSSSQANPWHMEDKNGNPIKVQPQLTRELRQPQWFDMSNGATFTPAHPAVNTLGGGRLEAQPNNIIRYPGGSEVEFNRQGIVATRHCR